MTDEADRAERDSALTAIAGALTEDERARILTRYAPEGSHQHGAHVDDLIEMAAAHDSCESELGPFYAENPGYLADLPPAAGTAALALCMAQVPLTVLNVKKLLLRAHLLPPVTEVLYWRSYTTAPMRAVTGYQASGGTDAYFVTWTGQRYLLCRWHKGLYPGDLEAIRQAVSTCIEVTTLDEGRRLADRFEQGEDLEWAAAWCHTPRPAMRTS